MQHIQRTQMKWLCVKRFFTHVSIHIVAVVLFTGPSLVMKVSWMELLAHAYTILQPVERVGVALPREKVH